MQNDAFQRIAIIVPRRPLQRARRVGIACFPTYTNTRGAKVDIFGLVFVVEPRRKKSHDVRQPYSAKSLTTGLLRSLYR